MSLAPMATVTARCREFMLASLERENCSVLSMAAKRG
jgi:hypothetical protein